MSSDPSAWAMLMVHVGYALFCVAALVVYGVGYAVWWLWSKRRKKWHG